MLWSLEKKVGFQIALASPAPWTNIIVRIPEHFTPLSKVPA